MLLLIFFIVTTQFIVQRSLKPELPTPTQEKKKEEEQITVVVEEECVYLDEEKITMEELAGYLAAKLADKATPEERAVVLDGKATVRYELMTMAANEIIRAGGLIAIMKVED